MSQTSFEASERESRRLNARALLWITVALAAAWSVGVYVDSRYHVHSGFEIESFLTPQHGLMYGGVAGVVLVVSAYLFEGWRLGERRVRWLPPGFWMVLIGAVAYLAAGGLDWLWHEAYGFEVDLEAVLSPTHILLVMARGLALVGLLLGALHYRASSEREPRKFLQRPDLPVVLAIAFLFGTVSWLFAYSNPFVVDYPAQEPVASNLHAVEEIDRAVFTAPVAATTGMMLYSVVLSLIVVSMLRRLDLPLGAISVVMVYGSTVLVFLTDLWRYLPAPVVAALVGEAVWARVRNRDRRDDARRGYWVLGAVIPFTVIAGYFAITAATGGIAWVIHLWAGAAVLAGLYGLIAALLVVPPASIERLGRQQHDRHSNGTASEAVDVRDEPALVGARDR